MNTTGWSYPITSIIRRFANWLRGLVRKTEAQAVVRPASKKPYAIHPGYVRSANDGDLHYVGADRLATLYGLSPRQYIVWDQERHETWVGRHWDDYYHLWPRPAGDYLASGRDQPSGDRPW